MPDGKQRGEREHGEEAHDVPLPVRLRLKAFVRPLTEPLPRDQSQVTKPAIL
jgi:hypothetical protein